MKLLTAGIFGTLGVSSIVAVGLFAAKPGSSPSGGLGNATNTRQPVLLELFTSEGCSSCPPADRLLETLDRIQPVAGADLIVLSEHVDYWDRLGWTDPFSSALFTQRQQDYVAALHVDSAYTPELVIDGRREVIGSDEDAARAAILKAEMETKVPVHLTAQRSGVYAKIEIEAGSVPKGIHVYVALAEDHAQSVVLRGENSGHTLRYVAVVRSLLLAGKGDGHEAFRKELTLPLKAGDTGGWRVIAFLQQSGSKHIVGAAQVRL